ncbi:glycosyl hydrolase [Purpureocillium lilacinum]|uniref:beta-glucosidase n=1 Tax=Purpureocillium lilacinum TaxID=33203 RepID=A0A179GXL5_PURLI|nr:glycosyl hydrolase [Purpureocillium lilacinum]OAQ82634.1 glycosyl hydrolase [Purpureocillium lilacinum]
MVSPSWSMGKTALVAALLALQAGVYGANNDDRSYATSPDIPPPLATGNNEWAAAFQKAEALVKQMTLEEKVSLTGGTKRNNSCSGNIAAIPRLNFPGMCLSDAGNGLRATDIVNGYPSGIHVGASWNKELTNKRGAAMGAEFRRKGVNVLLGPVVGPAWRVVKGGRNWEGFSADPYLAGSLVAQGVEGIQAQRHYIANEQETNRVPEDGVAAVSSNVDDRTMHEHYLWPFQDAVKAGSANIMCSYQRINNSYGCGNSKTLNGLLKTELGFQGFVVSDWGAQHTGVHDALSGLDMGMPSAAGYWESLLVDAVKNGSVAESRVTDMATRIIAAWYQVHQDAGFPEPGIGMPSNLFVDHKKIEGRSPDADAILLQGAIEGHVLLKNEKQTLPLKSPRKVSIFGYSAKTPDLAKPIEGDEFAAWQVGLAPVWGLPNKEESPIGSRGTLWGAGGSGAITPATFTSPQTALMEKAAKDGFTLVQDLNSSSPVVDPTSDVCIVFGNAWATEGHDRPALQDDYTDTLIKSVADQCGKTVVVLHNAGVRLVDGFVDHPNVTAIIFAHLPGAESGHALTAVLWGDANPSGKLTYTVAKQESDYGALLNPTPANGSKDPQSNFDEGIYMDYKQFEKNHIVPRYEFGFGLSYTRFDYSNIAITGPSGTSASEWPTGKVSSGGQEDLWETIATVTFTLKNGGHVDGAEAAQLYVRIPGYRAKQLRGFEKPFLAAGKGTQVSFALSRRDLSIWNTGAQKWQLQRGQYEIYVGRSSSKLPLKTYLTI